MKGYRDDTPTYAGESELYSIMNNVTDWGSLFPYANFYSQFIFPTWYQLRKYLFFPALQFYEESMLLKWKITILLGNQITWSYTS